MLYIWSFGQCDSRFCQNAHLFVVCDQGDYSVSVSQIQYLGIKLQLNMAVKLMLTG